MRSTTPRAANHRTRRTLLFLALLVVFIGGAWWWQRPPPEPVIEGTPLSAYLDEGFQRSDTARDYVEQLKSYGPAGVAWLAYKVEYGRHPFAKARSLPLDHAPDWLRRWFPPSWGGLHGASDIDERVEAADRLKFLGPGAAAAIPALARAIESANSSLVESAAETLLSIGPASWPAVRETLDHGSSHARIVLFDLLSNYLEPEGKDDEPAVAAELPEAVVIFIRAFHDPDPDVRAKAAEALGDCKELRVDDDLSFDPALLPVIGLLSDRNPAVLVQAARAVGKFKARAASAIPRLIVMLDDAEPQVRSAAALALALIEPTGRGYAVRLRAILHDPSPSCRNTATDALAKLTLAPDEEAAPAANLPSR